ncbi:hypothetical protein PRIPAC_76274, partial [Pristionchus pacificus]|uniref:Uncharacterized protein n=1 Tax=Pristionchus pacificus TaxID=54126 RepID=A0A2A6CS11_PRIPA
FVIMNPFFLFPFAYLLDHRNLHKFNAEENNHLMNTCGAKKGADLDWTDKAEVSIPWIFRIINYETLFAPLECAGILINDRHLITLSKCIRRRGDNVTIERNYKSPDGINKEEFSVTNHVAFRAKALLSNFLNTACLGFDRIEPYENDELDFLWLMNHKKVGHRAAEVERVLKPILCGSQRCDTTFVTKALPWTHTLSVLPYTQFITFHIGLCREGRGEDYTFNGEEIVAQNRTEPATFPVSTE